MKRTETEWAIRNLELAGYFKKGDLYDGMLGEAVKRLLECHQKEGHSGASHFACVHLFKQVALGEALTLEFWNEKFKSYNELASEHGVGGWTEKEFEEQVCKKPINRLNLNP